MSIIKIPHSGKAASLNEQVSQLKQLGIFIADDKTAKSHLLFVGYYRLLAYVKPFLPVSNANITFEQVWNLYTFDRKLRLLVIDAIERIEVAFRVSIAEIMSTQYDPFWYTHAEHFKHQKWHLEFMEKVLTLTRRKEHTLIRHFYNTYSHPKFPPSWIIAECLTFGTWSKVFDNLKRRSDKITIADRLNIRMMRLLSWIKSLTELRNLCAHHERIWNHFFRHTPKDVPNDPHQNHRFYQQAFVLDEMLRTISPQSAWKDRLKILMQEHNDIPIEKMGFSHDWKSDIFWEIEKKHIIKKSIKETILI
jgi:abortive infection bacteriophage resistance protein